MPHASITALRKIKWKFVMDGIVKYQLFSNGSLLEGADEKKALKAIQALTKLPEDRARTLFLSGKQFRIALAYDKDLLEKREHHYQDPRNRFPDLNDRWALEALLLPAKYLHHSLP